MRYASHLSLSSLSLAIPPHSTSNPGKNLTKETCRSRDRFLALCFPARPEQTEINAAPFFGLPPLCLLLLLLFLLVCALHLKQAQFSYIPIAMKCPAASVSCKNTGSFSWGSSAPSVQNAQRVCMEGCHLQNQNAAVLRIL